MEDGHVESGIKSPELVPAGLLEELRFRELAPDPAIKRFLHLTREHFKADHHVRPQGVELRQHLQLPTMVLEAVVRFPQQHDRAPRRAVDHLLGFDLLAAGNHPDRDRHAAGVGGSCRDRRCANRRK